MMNIPDESKREESALDALVTGAIYHSDCEGIQFEDLAKLEGTLTADDLAALNTLPSNLTDLIIDGLSTPMTSEAVERDARSQRLETAMHRGDESGELSDAARAEMERRRLEAQSDDHEPKKDLPRE
jgi:hypothetical protein